MDDKNQFSPAPQSRSPRPKRPRVWINALLYITTLICVFFAGAIHLSAQTENQAIQNGLVFVLAVMGILTAHEAGHYIFARKHQVRASLPYFLPMIPLFSLFGTLGAIIVMKGRIRSRTALMQVGAAGPLFGMAVAIPVLFFGIATCRVTPIPEQGFIEGQSLLYILAKRLMLGPIPDGYDILINESPLAFAGWFGMLITMLNLLPIGQLDGGHVCYALFGERHHRISVLVHRFLFLFGIGTAGMLTLNAYNAGISGETLIEAAMPGFSWVFLAGLMWLMFRKRGGIHPPVDDQHLSRGSRLAGLACIGVFIITFMPVVMRPIIH